jgi:hypothetical protein
MIPRCDTSPRCERCGCDMPYEHELIPSMTAYHWDGSGPDPNRPLRLCPECADEHVDHMEWLWAEHYRGLL